MLLTARFSSVPCDGPVLSGGQGAGLTLAEASLLAAEVRAAQALGLVCWTAGASVTAATLADAVSGGTAAGLRKIVLSKEAVTEDAEPARLVDRVRLVALRARLEQKELPEIVVPVDHPAAMDVAAMAAQGDVRGVAEACGRRVLRHFLNAVMDACDRDDADGFDPTRCTPLADAVARARAAGVPEAAVRAAIILAAEGAESFTLADAASPDDVPADILPVILALPDAFIEAALTRHGFAQSVFRHADAAQVLDDIALQIWQSGRPRLIFSDRPAARGIDAGATAATGRVQLYPFVQTDGFDVDGFCAAVRLLTLQLCEYGADIVSIDLGGMAEALLALALPYDSIQGRTTAAALAALSTAETALALADLAARQGAGIGAGRQGFAVTIKEMRDRLAGGAFSGALSPMDAAALDPSRIDRVLHTAVTTRLQAAAVAVERHGMLAWPLTHISQTPLGLDAMPAGLSPVVGLVLSSVGDDGTPAHRRLSASVEMALTRLGYNSAQIDDIDTYVNGRGTLRDAPAINHAVLRARGFDDAALGRIDAALAYAASIDHAMNRWVLGHAFCQDVLGLADDDDDVLAVLGFDAAAVAAAGLYACGAGTLTGAPHLRPPHQDVFATEAEVPVSARVMMQAAVETGLTGTATQTLVLDPSVSPASLRGLILTAWEMGAATLALYRPSCGLDAAVAPVRTAPADNEAIDKEKKIRSAGH